MLSNWLNDKPQAASRVADVSATVARFLDKHGYGIGDRGGANRPVNNPCFQRGAAARTALGDGSSSGGGSGGGHVRKRKKSLGFSTSKKSRNDGQVEQALEAIREAARNDQNTMPALVEGALANCTLGEMVQALADVYGRYTSGPEW